MLTKNTIQKICELKDILLEINKTHKNKLKN